LSIPANDCEDDEDFKLTPEQEAEIEEFVAAWKEEHEGDLEVESDEEVELPRYQLQVRLVDDRDVP
jgi:hypothetical protein